MAKSSKKAKAKSLNTATRSSTSLPTVPSGVKSSGGRLQKKETCLKPWAGAKVKK